ncbi:tripartite tricarboxylate transporter TctB family protein [Roseateles sp. L2-2]|uniref:tripartite tricarboxylate transporter TctB family protein n=1 Tax=Roseateles sp. L2-2 TaxID=3422597 RepID=UPI003D36E47C
MNEVLEEGGPTRRAVELGSAAVLLALAVLVVWDNLRIGAGWSGSGPEAGYFPLRIGVALGACAVAVFVQALRTPDAARFATWSQLKRVAQVLVPLTIYVALIVPLGLYVASALFIAVFMVFVGRYPAWKALLMGVALNAAMFYVFEIQFKVPLPKGPLEAWLGY